MRSEEITAPRGHHDQQRYSQLGEFRIIVEEGTCPSAKVGERQGHRAHELGRVNRRCNLQLARRRRARQAPRSTRSRIVCVLRSLSNVKRKHEQRKHKRRCGFRLTHSQETYAISNHRVPEDPVEENVSGGSKKQLCHRAESESVPAFHCCSVFSVAAIMPPSPALAGWPASFQVVPRLPLT